MQSDPNSMPAVKLPDKECDLVMKGGITSGVIYPAAVRSLSEEYRFRNVGGASAGAIAASLTAAAEYGRRTGRGGFEVLDQVTQQVAQEGFLLSLFQPTPGARPLYEVAMGYIEDTTSSKRTKAFRAIRQILRRVPAVSVTAAILVVGLIVVAVLGGRGPWKVATVSFAVVFGVIGLVVAAVVCLVLLVLRFIRGITDNGFGLCSGKSESGFGPAFTDWLHENVQRCAGLDPDTDPPLTFAQLLHPPDGGPPIDLRLITTDLSYSRPVALPFGHRQYLFNRKDMERLFPPAVAEAMWQAGPDPGAEFLDMYLGDRGTDFRYMPSEDLPVVVAFRFSLSFPILISAVRLYSYNALSRKGVLTNWFSDGGISSNFPIHFFDSLLPGRPTFGLDFEPFPKVSSGVIRDAKPEDVYMLPDAYTQQLPRWASIDGLGGFVSQIVDALENWRDTMQSELPGFRDRVCHIRLQDNEGGLNLAMPVEVIRGLIDRGTRAGDLIKNTWHDDQWKSHRFTRYLTAMQMLQTGVQKMAQPVRWGEVGPFIRLGAPGVKVYRTCHDPTWCASAADGTDALIAVTADWGTAAHPDFAMSRECPDDDPTCQHCEPLPTPTLRILPNV